MKRSVILLILLLCLGIAHSQGGAVSQRFIDQMLDLNTWMNEASSKLSLFTDAFTNIGSTLAYAGLLLGAIGLIGQGMSAMQGLFGRMIIASLLLALSPLINNIAIDSWESIRKFSSSSLQQTFENSYAKFELFGQETSNMLSGLASIEASQTLQGTNTNVPSSESDMQGFLRMVSLSGLFLVFSTIFLMLMLVATGLAIQLAGLILPLAAGLMAMNAQTGAKWLSAYIRVVTTSLFFVLVIPTIFALAFDLTVVRSIDIINGYTANTTASINTLAQQNASNALPLDRIPQLEQDIASNQQTLSQLLQDDNNYDTPPGTQGNILQRGWNNLSSTAQAAYESTTNAITSIQTEIQNIITQYATDAKNAIINWWTDFRQFIWRLIVSLVMLLISLVGALFLIIRGEAIVSQLLQGMSMEVASFMTRAMSRVRTPAVSAPSSGANAYRPNVGPSFPSRPAPVPQPYPKSPLPPRPSLQHSSRSNTPQLPPRPLALPPSRPLALPSPKS